MATARSSPVGLTFAPGCDGLDALGVPDAGALLGDPDDPAAVALPGAAGERAAVVDVRPGRVELRFPLPGTPDASGRFREPPRGAGTGWVRLVRYGARGLDGARARWRARLTAPQSRSLAARDWNLACHLKAAGVATPDLLALGEAGRGPVAARSFLVFRELEGWTPLDRWLAASGEDAPGDGARADAGAAVRRTLEAVRRAGVELPHLALGDLWIAPAGCAAPAPDLPGAPTLVRAPGIAVARFDGGAVLASAGSDDGWDAVLARLEREGLPGPA